MCAKYQCWYKILGGVRTWLYIAVFVFAGLVTSGEFLSRTTGRGHSKYIQVGYYLYIYVMYVMYFFSATHIYIIMTFISILYNVIITSSGAVRLTARPLQRAEIMDAGKRTSNCVSVSFGHSFGKVGSILILWMMSVTLLIVAVLMAVKS